MENNSSKGEIPCYGLLGHVPKLIAQNGLPFLYRGRILIVLPCVGLLLPGDHCYYI